MDLDAKGDITSEEKLLRLIRKKAAPVQEPALPSSPQGINAKEKNDLLILDQGKKKVPSVDLVRILNWVLIAFIFTASGFIVYKYQHENLQMNPPITKKADNMSSDEVSTKIDIASKKPFDFYQKKIEARDIFESPWEKALGDNNADQQSSPALDFTKELKLVGIVLDKDPKAIIEDLRSNQTLFLSKGEKIGEAVLSEIQEGKVIFLYNDEKVELIQ